MSYARTITDEFDFVSGEIFAKILTTNDNNSKHGVLIPPASYGFFPELPILDPKENASKIFSATNTTSKQASDLSWRYYQKYPERRITRASPLLNDHAHGRRLIIMTQIRYASGEIVYYVDVVLEDLDPRFTALVGILFAGSSLTSPGAYVLLPLDASQFVVDENLGELLKRFDEVKALGWVDSLRTGDTGIGYTFESLVGIEENNSPEADFHGIEIKCKLQNGKQSSSGKINLFQCGPQWLISGPMLSRIHVIGAPNDKGVMSCYSQVTTTGNNKGLWLGPSTSPPSLSLFKNDQVLGKWNHKKLSDRLEQKHSRAVFIVAESRKNGGHVQYRYTGLLYCERPHIDRFVSLVAARRIIFEFAMRLNEKGKVRNHGYPWRLVDERDLDQLFAFQIQLRKEP